MSEIEQINPTDSGRVAFEKTGRNVDLLAKVFGEVNDRSTIATYKSYTKVPNVTAKWKSIAECMAQLPNTSILMCDIQESFEQRGEFPTSSGLITIFKSNINRALLIYSASIEQLKDSRTYFSWYRDAATAEKFKFKRFLTEEDIRPSIETLGFKNTDFSTSDFDGNIIKVVEKVGYQKQAMFYFYEGNLPNLNASVKNKLGVTVDGFAMEVNNTSNNACPNVVRIYPNNSSDCYVVHYDNSVRYGGKVALVSRTEVTTYQNGWTHAWSDAHRLQLCKVGDIVTINGTLVAGTVTADTIICTIPAAFRNSKRSINFVVNDFSSPQTVSASIAIYVNGEMKFRRGSISNGSTLIFSVSYRIE